MGCEAEAEKERSIPRLPLFSVPPMQSPERSGTLTPPLHTSAAVPFRWEQEPGKPRPCTTLVPFTNPNDFLPKCLELPPRLLLPSPTTVLEGPYVGSNRFRSPSFKMTNDCYGSFGAERGLLGALVLRKGERVKRNKGWWLGSWRKKAFRVKIKREVTGGSHVFPSSADRDAAATIGGTTHSKASVSKMKRAASFSGASHGKSRVWVRFNSLFKVHAIFFHILFW